MKQSCRLLLLFIMMCCCGISVKAKKNTNSSFLFISDVHLNPQGQQTNYGQDAGMDVWNAFKTKVNAVMSAKKAPGFVIYTGDLPVHNGWCSALEDTAAMVHDSAMAMVLNELRSISVKYNKPVFYMPGNNDALSGDYLNFTNAQGQTALSLIKAAPVFFPKNKSTKKKAANPQILSQNTQYCYYAARVMQGLRLIALNTVIFNTGCPDTGNATACAQEMVWLRSQLANAKRAGDKVYIAMHIPPGGTYNGGQMWNTFGGMWADTFLQMTAAYSTTIAGVFYGHTHMDELRRLWGPNNDTVCEVAICCPGISAQHGNNPGFKIISYDKRSKEPVDFTTLYTPLPLNGGWPDSSYSFRETFNCPTGTIYNFLKNADLNTIAADVANIYQVKNGTVTPGTVIGFIEVKTQ